MTSIFSGNNYNLKNATFKYVMQLNTVESKSSFFCLFLFQRVIHVNFYQNHK